MKNVTLTYYGAPDNDVDPYDIDGGEVRAVLNEEDFATVLALLENN